MSLSSIPYEHQPHVVRSAHGKLDGVWVGPAEVARAAHAAGFRDLHLFEAVAVAGSESWLYDKAHCDNVDDSTGETSSRDVGLWQINIPANEIGTKVETYLLDHDKNAHAAYELWSRRGWQPWVGHNTGAWLHDTYQLWAMFGVGNFWMTQNVRQKGTHIHSPAVTLGQMKKLFPNVPLG